MNIKTAVVLIARGRDRDGVRRAFAWAESEKWNGLCWLLRIILAIANRQIHSEYGRVHSNINKSVAVFYPRIPIPGNVCVRVKNVNKIGSCIIYVWYVLCVWMTVCVSFSIFLCVSIASDELPCNGSASEFCARWVLLCWRREREREWESEEQRQGKMDETVPYWVGARQWSTVHRLRDGKEKKRAKEIGRSLASKLNFPYEINEMRDNRNMYGSCIRIAWLHVYLCVCLSFLSRFYIIFMIKRLFQNAFVEL